MLFIYVALVANIIITGYYGTYLLFKPTSTMIVEAYGNPSIASKIVGAFYYTVAILSAYCLLNLEGKLYIVKFFSHADYL